MSDLRGFYYEPVQDSRFRCAMTPFMSRGKDMKTSKEMQLKIIDKMRENVEGSKPLYSGIEYKDGGRWQDKALPEFYLDDQEMRVKPETITINGVEIPKPTEKKDWRHILFEPSSRKRMRREVYQDSFHLYDDGALLYADAEQAITASKALFGIKGE